MIIQTPTPEQLEALRAAGQFWWYQPGDGSYYATAVNTPQDPGDAFCLVADAPWVAQWPDEGWGQSAYDYLAPMIAEYNAASEQTGEV